MDTKKIKEGLSVKEIEGFAKTYRFALFCCVALVLAWIFSFVFFEGWSIFCAVLGGLLGVVLTKKVEDFLKKVVAFVRKQEELTQLVLGGASLVLSVFLPFLLFFVLGACAGVALPYIGVERSLDKKE